MSPLGEASCENTVYEAPAAVLTANLAAEGAPDMLMLSTKTRALVLHEGSPRSTKGSSSPGTVVPANCTNPFEIGLCPPVLTLVAFGLDVFWKELVSTNMSNTSV